MNPRSQVKVAMTYGAILGLAGTVVYMLFYFAGIPQSKFPGYIGYVLTIITIVFGVKSYRDQELGGFISYGRSLGTGVLIGLFSGIISAVFTYLLFAVIDTELAQKILDTAQQQMAEKQMSEEQMEMALNISRKFMSPPVMSLIVLVSSVFMATIFSLIISIFLKKDANPFDNKSLDAI